MEITTIKLSDIYADEDFNCRGKIVPMDVVDLAKDIEQNGLIQPVTVAPREGDVPYLLIAGYRRYTAHRVLKLDTIQCIIREDMQDETKARFFNLSENLKRKELNTLQEAKALKRLHDLGVNEFVAAEKLGMSRGWVQIRYMVLKLPEVVQQEIAAGFLSSPQIRDAYSHFRKGGVDACIDVVKQIKESRLRGEKGKRFKPKKDPSKELTAKRVRKRPEIFGMMEHIQEHLGNGLHTRCLAWAAGEISNLDLFCSIKLYDEKNGDGNYKVPA